MGRRRRTARRSGRASGRRLYHPPGDRGMHTRYGFAMTAVLLTLSAGSPNVKTREIEYRQGDTVLQGFIALDVAAPGQRPCVLVLHVRWGHKEHARNHAQQLGANRVSVIAE